MFLDESAFDVDEDTSRNEYKRSGPGQRNNRPTNGINYIFNYIFKYIN
jgi:hypothetical protein